MSPLPLPFPLNLHATPLLLLVPLTPLPPLPHPLNHTTSILTLLTLLTLTPGIATHQPTLSNPQHGNETPACAAMTSGYVFRVENAATVAYLQRVGVTGRLVTVAVHPPPLPTEARNARQTSGMGDMGGMGAVPPTLTILAIAVLVRCGDWMALGAISLLILARTLNALLFRRRIQGQGRGWHGASEPGVQGDLLVLLSQDRWVRLRGQVDALKAVTSGCWMRDLSPGEGCVDAVAKVCVYLAVVVGFEGTEGGKGVLGALVLGSAGVVGWRGWMVGRKERVGREGRGGGRWEMHGCGLSVVGEKRYERRKDLAEELVRETGRDDWALRLGMINEPIFGEGGKVGPVEL